MDNKNTGLKVLVVVLSILVLALSGYIVYDKVLNKNELPLENNIGTENNNEENVSSDITEQEIKNIFDFVYDYYELPEVYCGENEIITDINDEMHMYHLSTEYSTYNEMLNDLKKYMSMEVISKGNFASTNKDFYVEKDGKLYCVEQYKGYPYGRGEIDIEITSKNENTIAGLATMELTDMSNNKTYDKVNITLEKNNDNWIVTSYEKQN